MSPETTFPVLFRVEDQPAPVPWQPSDSQTLNPSLWFSLYCSISDSLAYCSSNGQRNPNSQRPAWVDILPSSPNYIPRHAQDILPGTSVFSSEGWLCQVESAYKGISGSGHTTIAARGKDRSIVITERKILDKLLDASTITHILTNAPHISS
ncbi:hypothetical protein BD779DRAFT_1805263 [Infundibulicybe gibba]|nr:hypothetical protein BD779DRAFT_1805263 [Infundibulicybe gibba]